METLSDLIAIYKAEMGIASDEAAASSLQLGKTAFSNYRNGSRRLPDTAIVKLADVTGHDAREIIALVNANLKTTPPHEREFWINRLTAFACATTTAAMNAGPEVLQRFS